MYSELTEEEMAEMKESAKRTHRWIIKKFKQYGKGNAEEWIMSWIVGDYKLVVNLDSEMDAYNIRIEDTNGKFITYLSGASATRLGAVCKDIIEYERLTELQQISEQAAQEGGGFSGDIPM